MSARNVVRTSAKALIRRGEEILVTENHDANGLWYILPGGGQDHGETLVDALKRECREEIGAEISVGDVKFVREYIADGHEFHAGAEGLHQIDLVFECQVDERYVPGLGIRPDGIQSRVLWMTVAELEQVRFFPRPLLAALAQENIGGGLVYLGNVI